MTQYTAEPNASTENTFAGMLNHDKTSSNGTFLNYPPPISSDRIEFLISKGIAPDVASIDLEMVKMKLADKDEGLGWSLEQCQEGELSYKRFLHLCKIYGKGIVPTKTMDSFWHYHILDTRSYCAMCDEIFGGYLHHYPYFGMRGEEDVKDLDATFVKTKKLYKKHFGESISSVEGTDCWHDCQGRCWNECKSSF